MKILIYLSAVILLCGVSEISAQCVAKAVGTKRYFACTFNSEYNPYKKPIAFANVGYRNVTVSFTSSYIPKMTSDVMVITAGYYLINLTITRSKLTEIAPGAFTPFPRLEVLSLTYNNVSMLENYMFNSSKALLSLNISHNNISEIKPEAFQGIPLQVLDLSYNKIDAIGSTHFKQLHFIRYLNLSHNSIRGIDGSYFDGAINLLELNLRGNLIQTFPNCLMHLSLLTKLDLSNNLISRFDPSVFTGLISLNVLDISFNKFIEVPWGPLKETTALKNLDVSGNAISYKNFKLDKLISALTVKNITIGRNKLPCEELDSLIRRFKSLGLHVVEYLEHDEVNINGIACLTNHTGTTPSTQVSDNEGLEDAIASKLHPQFIGIYVLLVVIILIGCAHFVVNHSLGRRRVIGRNIKELEGIL